MTGMRTFGELDLLPAYALSDAAFCLRLPRPKVQRWTEALTLPSHEQHKDLPYVAISYANLLELHVLKAMRIKHDVPLQRIRRAIAYLHTESGSPHPLLDREFSTNGLDLFFEKDGDLINASRHGQSTIREMVDIFLARIEWKNDAGSSFFPFVRENEYDEPKYIQMQPGVAFGRPVLAGTGVAADVVAGRFSAWESAADLADEYNVPIPMIEAAVRWEMPYQYAA